MADKMVVHEAEHTATAPDPVYSIAENVRKVAEAEQPTAEPAAEKEKKSASRPQKTPAAKTRASPKKASAKSAAIKISAALPKAEKPKKQKTKPAPESQAAPLAEKKIQKVSDKSSPEDDYFTFKPHLLWKVSTVILAILVIWSYFFR